MLAVAESLPEPEDSRLPGDVGESAMHRKERLYKESESAYNRSERGKRGVSSFL